MSAVILPGPEDIELDPRAAEVLAQAALELNGRLPDSTELSQGQPTELDELRERAAARQDAARQQAKQAEAAREQEARDAAQQPNSASVGRAQPRVAENTFLADLEAARQQLELLQAMPKPHELHAQPASDAGDATDDDVEFFRNPKEAVAKAIANHPAMAALKGAAVETYQRKTAEQFTKEFPQAEEWMRDDGFREWVGASKVRVALLRSAHENYDLEAAREVFGNWNALRGGSASTTKAAKVKVYRRSDIQKMMIDDPRRYEQMADEIAAAYKSGKVR